MLRKFKTLGIAFVAILAIETPSATFAEFHSEAAHTTIAGGQPVFENTVFTFKAGTVSCNQVSYSGTTSTATTSSIPIEPKYEFCNAFGFVSTKVDVECEYSFTSSNFSQLHIYCGPTDNIIITAFNCHVEIDSQTASGITYDNDGLGAGRNIRLTANVSGLRYEQRAKQFPGCTNGHFTDGKLVGSVILKGSNTAGNSVGIWHQ